MCAIKDLFFMQQVGFSHVWYLPIILRFYFLIPIVANGLNSVQADFPHILVRIYSIALFIVPLIIHSFRLINGGRTSLVFQISEGFSGGKYGFSSVVIAYAITRIPEVGNWLLFRRNKKYV